MKLSRQINLAFAILLVVVLGITAVLFYSLLSDQLVAEQRKEMKEKGKEWLETVVEQGNEIDSRDLLALRSISARGGRIEAILYRGNGRLLYSTLPDSVAIEWLEDVKGSDKKERRTLKNGDDPYIVEIISLRGVGKEKLILAAPLRGIKSVQSALAQQMLVVLAVGAAVAYLLSLLITRRLVRPLERLGRELRKVEERRFADVERIDSGGEIGEVADQVYRMAVEMERYHRLQREFFQNVSHELKTPLMSIQGYAEGIRDGVFEGKIARQGLDVIVNESIRLKQIVNEMILLAKLESEADIFSLQEMSVPYAVEEALARVNPLALQRKIFIETRFPEQNQGQLCIMADQDKLLQALLNLMGNCIRHARSTVVVEISLLDGHVVIRIADDGDGIPEALLPHLFKRFTKGSSGETGLGLAISRAIIERCGGQVRAENLPDGGALFTMWFPQAER